MQITITDTLEEIQLTEQSYGSLDVALHFEVMLGEGDCPSTSYLNDVAFSGGLDVYDAFGSVIETIQSRDFTPGHRRAIDAILNNNLDRYEREAAAEAENRLQAERDDATDRLNDHRERGFWLWEHGLIDSPK
jgi:hypothetical protein